MLYFPFVWALWPSPDERKAPFFEISLVRCTKKVKKDFTRLKEPCILETQKGGGGYPVQVLRPQYISHFFDSCKSPSEPMHRAFCYFG